MHPNDPIGFLTKNCAGVRNLGMQVKTFSTNMLLVRQSPRQNEWIPAFQCFSIQSWWAFNVMVTLGWASANVHHPSQWRPKTHLSHLLWCDCWRNPTSMVKPQQQCMQRFLLEAKNEVRRPSNDTQIQVLVLEPDFFSFHFNKIQALKYSKVPNQTNVHPLRSEKMKISIWW